jgi:hypothetical protein
MDNPQAPESVTPTPASAHKFRVKFLDGPAAGITKDYDRETPVVRYGFWTYEHTHRRDGDHWLFVRRLNPRPARRLLRAVTAMRGQDPRMDEKTHPDRVIKRGRNAPCWCGSGKKFKACHASPQSN